MHSFRVYHKQIGSQWRALSNYEGARLRPRGIGAMVRGLDRHVRMRCH